jgi:ABC-type spermidine/putrescine transport system permease subunit I
MITIIGTLWLTYIIRAYAWRIILAGVGPINKILTTVGILSEPISFAPGYGAVIVGLIYVFLPFMILTLYSSINNIDINLEEASLSLGANRLKTFLKVTLPLSRNGIISGVLLVFVLALGVYVTASILGNPSEWTLAIFIGDTITELLNIPFAAAMSMVLIALVIGSLGLLAMLTKAKQKGVS